MSVASISDPDTRQLNEAMPLSLGSRSRDFKWIKFYGAIIMAVFRNDILYDDFLGLSCQK